MAKQNRKPVPPPSSRVPANTILDAFTKEKKIVLGLSAFKVAYTNTGTMIVDKPNIVVMYEDEVDQNNIQKPH